MLHLFSKKLGGVLHKDICSFNIALPIGISFFTFQMISYLFDVYYKKSQVQKNILNLGLYVSFFPQLIAGPIVRYNQIEVEIQNREESLVNISSGIQRFIIGLGKKALIADFVGQIADNIFSMYGKNSALLAWYGAVAYTLQIYFDFSGYSDMAIGLGRMFGFHFDENFAHPYESRSVTEFWRRWHISLSSWFRDYVYIALGGNRVTKGRWILNLFIVWLLTGIWHGANWTFLCWGLLYFIILLIEKFTRLDKRKGVLSWIMTIVIVTVAWVIFRSDSIAAAGQYIYDLIGINGTGISDTTFAIYLKGTWVVMVMGIIGASSVVSNTGERLKKNGHTWVVNVWIFIVLILSGLRVVCSTYNPFIYFNF